MYLVPASYTQNPDKTSLKQLEIFFSNGEAIELLCVKRADKQQSQTTCVFVTPPKFSSQYAECQIHQYYNFGWQLN